ncbi:MAG: hypothetical protein AAF411_01870 [Myxococcota bacterium]
MSEMPSGIVVEEDALPKRTLNYRTVYASESRFRATHRRHAPNRELLTLLGVASIVTVIGGASLSLWMLAAVVPLTWYLLGTWLNRCTITIEDGLLSTSCGPIPMPFQRNPESAEMAVVKGFYAEKRQCGSTKQGPIFEYVVMADIHGGDIINVTSGLSTHDAASFLRDRFERHRAAIESQLTGAKVRVEETAPDAETVGLNDRPRFEDTER